MSEDDSAMSGARNPTATADDDNMNELTSSSSSDSDEDEDEERPQQQQRPSTVLFPGTFSSSVLNWTLCFPQMNVEVISWT